MARMYFSWMPGSGDGLSSSIKSPMDTYKVLSKEKSLQTYSNQTLSCFLHANIENVPAAVNQSNIISIYGQQISSKGTTL